LLNPEKDYETRGWVDNVVFPCGAIADEAKDELRLYYGGADTRICLATGSLSEVVNACAENI
jgi:beta-1,4-mannooligosaccharide/beta-1,4-mannosyl-N-acetylglucosamine phosphorylase